MQSERTYGVKPPSRGSASAICTDWVSSVSHPSNLTPTKISLFGKSRATIVNHFPSQSSSKLAVLASALSMESSKGRPEREEGPGLEVPCVRIPRAGREDVALGQVGVVGDDEIRTDCSLVSLVWQRRHRVNDRDRGRSHVSYNRIPGSIKRRMWF